VPAFGAVLIAVMFGYFLLSGSGADADDVAYKVAVPTETPLPKSNAPAAISAPDTGETAENPVKPAKVTVEDKIVPVKASEKRSVQRAPMQKSPNQVRPTGRTQMPTLAEQNDDEDDSLRLSDMFDDIDTSR
jgi:hypothetical protein